MDGWGGVEGVNGRGEATKGRRGREKPQANRESKCSPPVTSPPTMVSTPV